MRELEQSQLDQIDQLLTWIPRLKEPGLIFLHPRGPTEFPLYDPLVYYFISDLRAVRWPQAPMEWRMTELPAMADNAYLVEHAGFDQLVWMLVGWEEFEKMLSWHWDRTLRDGTVLRMLWRLQTLRERMGVRPPTT